MKLLLVVIFAILCLLQINSLSLTHEQLPPCLWRPLGDIDSNPKFTYTITKQWTAEEAAQLKSGALNTSDFIDVKGWTPYNPKKPFEFFTKIGREGLRHYKTWTPIKKVLKGSDAPEYYLSDADLALAFGTPSTAAVYEVPKGENIILLRFQTKVSGSPYIGRWAVLLDSVKASNIEAELNKYTKRFDALRKVYKLTALEVTRALNIIPAFTESSVFWAIVGETSLPAVGKAIPIVDSAYIERIEAGQQFLAGYIADGQQNIIQVKDSLPGNQRNQCPL